MPGARITLAVSGQTVSVSAKEEAHMIVLGVVCLILGLILGSSLLWTIGLILIVVGIILALLGMADRAIGPRRHYW